MVETGDDRSIMLADFGETVSYTPSGGSAKDVTGIFDTVDQAVEAGGSVPFAMSQPRLTVRSSDVVGISEGDDFVIRSSSYKVVIVMADGTGITEIALEDQ